MRIFAAFCILLAACAQAKDINFRPTTKIVGGDEAVPHSLPYQVGMYVYLPQGRSFCGGSLVSTQHVLTAAHCTDKASSALIMLGAHNISTVEEHRQEFETSNFAVHENWFPLFILNDIAMVKLNEIIKIDGAFINTIALAPETEDTVLTGQLATVSGWGKPSDEVQTVSSVLRYVNSTIIENKICNIFYFGSIREDHICLNGWEGKSSCSGDSGGPLVINRDGNTVQYGVVSFGIRFGCEIGWPSVYTSVPKYRSWIDEKLQSF
ncbi:hypothetical protein RI129_002540 [Pyrocoelia pectoralis]|uniref:Peptidase S1 domain-containing protein n=1 Tax=Pyrocoelia pectoralis TaxID=417401 RepID=A0AAN7ZTP5_9COLE